MNTPNMPPLTAHLQFSGQNVLKDMQEQQTAMVEALQDLFAEQSVMKGLISVLIATHPNPKLLAEAFLLYMDSIADSTRPERIEIYRAAAQKWMDVLMTRVNQQNQRGAL